MTELSAWLILFALISGVMLLMYGPSRSDLWHVIELWAGDNRRAALKRERRRSQRKALKTRQPEAHRTFPVEALPDSGGQPQ